MIKSFVLSLFCVIFAEGIAGSHDPATREKLIPPFPFYKDKMLERVSDMTKKKTVSEVKRDFFKAWGEEYDYSLITTYHNNKQKLPIICKEHGVFFQSANAHSRGVGCPKCANKKNGDRCKMTVTEFLEKVKSVHGNSQYDYSLISEDNFIDAHHKVPIVCKLHDKVFYQTPKDHLSGKGCFLCGKESMAKAQRYTKDELIGLFNSIHNGRYDYSLFNEKEYKNRKDKIKVICPKHGVFSVSVSNHLYRKSGCPKCKRSFGEEKISSYLDGNNIVYKEQVCFRNESPLCNNLRLQTDFYLPEYNTIIEYNGIQHFREVGLFHLRTLKEQQKRDEALREYCKLHKVNLIEIPYWDLDNIEAILKENIK